MTAFCESQAFLLAQRIDYHLAGISLTGSLLTAIRVSQLKELEA